MVNVVSDHTQTYILYGSSGRVIGPTPGPLPENTQHSQETGIHIPGGIRTSNPIKLSAVDPSPRPHGHWIGLSLLALGLAGCMAMNFSDIHVSYLHYTLHQLINV
jgi:hypothetical protein